MGTQGGRVAIGLSGAIVFSTSTAGAQRVIVPDRTLGQGVVPVV